MHLPYSHFLFSFFFFTPEDIFQFTSKFIPCIHLSEDKVSTVFHFIERKIFTLEQKGMINFFATYLLYYFILFQFCFFNFFILFTFSYKFFFQNLCFIVPTDEKFLYELGNLIIKIEVVSFLFFNHIFPLLKIFSSCFSFSFNCLPENLE